jgi:hypothetical protein
MPNTLDLAHRTLMIEHVHRWAPCPPSWDPSSAARPLPANLRGRQRPDEPGRVHATAPALGRILRDGARGFAACARPRTLSPRARDALHPGRSTAITSTSGGTAAVAVGIPARFSGSMSISNGIAYCPSCTSLTCGVGVVQRSHLTLRAGTVRTRRAHEPSRHAARSADQRIGRIDDHR